MEKTISIQSKLENLVYVERMVDEISERFNLSKEVYGKMIIATIEAVNNSIVHGNGLDESKMVHISYQEKDSHIHIHVKDQGAGFDYASVPDPTLPENIENVSGRGVFLMRNLADYLVFHANGSEVELVFRR